MPPTPTSAEPTGSAISNYLKKSKKLSSKSVIIFILVFAAVGGIILWRSFALSSQVDTVETENMLQLKDDGTTASLPPYSSSISGPSIVSNVSKASGTKEVKFYTKNSPATSITLVSQKTLSADVDSVSVSAFGKEYDATCAGVPKVSLVVDNTVVVQPTNVTFSRTAYKGNISLSKGTKHTIKVVASNIGVKKCSNGAWDTRILTADVVSFYGPAPTTTPAPTLAFSASSPGVNPGTQITVNPGSQVTLTWGTTNASNCSTTDTWQGVAIGLSGSYTIGAINNSSTYGVTCTGGGGSTHSSVQVNVSQPTGGSGGGGSTAGSGCINGSGQGWHGYGGNSYPSSWPNADCQLYSSNSPFNLLIGPNPQIHPQSSSIISTALASGIGSLSTGQGSGHDYNHPVYYAQPNDPLVTISTGGWANGKQIRVPSNAKPASSSDGHLSVVYKDPSNGIWYEYDFWQASRPDANTIKASIVYRQNFDGPGIVTQSMINADKTIGGTTAPYYGLEAGVIRGPELAAGRINHALFIVISCGSSDTSFGYGVKAPGASGRGGSGSFVFPAFKGDAACSGVRAPMGARFWLDMTPAQIDATGAPTWEKAIAKAMNQYGGYMGDTGGPGFGFELESSAMYTSLGAPNPYETLAKSLGLSKDPTYGYTFRFSGKIPWASHMHVLVPPSSIP